MVTLLLGARYHRIRVTLCGAGYRVWRLLAAAGNDHVEAGNHERVLAVEADLYHSMMMREDARKVLSGNLDLVGHVQIADVPVEVNQAQVQSTGAR